MGNGYEQFYRTWCYSGRSVSGADGWKVRAKSDGLPLPEAEGMGDLASYWCPTEFSRETPPGRRLALFRRQNDSVLVHGAPVAGLVGGRGGVSFEHGVVGLPKGVSALEAVRLWRSPAWRVEDGSFSPKLERFAWHAVARGPDFPVQSGGASGGDGDDGVALGILNRGDVMPWAAYVLRACLAATDGTVDKVFLAGKDDTIVRLLFLAFYCLPEQLRSRLTFSTHENPKATKGVQIVGVTTFEGEEADLPRHCYEGKYCALNTYSGDKTESLRTSLFAETAIQWILYGQYGLLAAVRTNFDALAPADNPGAAELDLLAEHAPIGGEAPAGTEGLLKLCGSAAIGHAKLRDRNEFSSMIRVARDDNNVKEGLVAQFSKWLPSHGAAVEELPKRMSESGFDGLREGESFADLAWLGEFGGRLGNCEQKYWEGLLVKCHGAVGEATFFPALQTRIGLIGRWEKWHRLDHGRGDAFSEVVEKWLQVQPQELGVVLSSELREDLRREAVRLWLRSGIPDSFRKVVEGARKIGVFRDQMVAQLKGLVKEQSNALNGFSQQLAGMGLSDLKLRCGFDHVQWLGNLAGEAGQGKESEFWEQLLANCAVGASRPELGNSFVPDLETRISLLERWEKTGKAGQNERLQGLAEAWLRGTPQEVVKVIESGLSVSLKVTGLRLCFGRSAPVESREAGTILNLVCKEAALTKAVFFEMPGWQAGTAVKRVPEDCFRVLLACQDEQMRLADLLGERTLEAVEFWNRNAPKAVPLRMRARLSFGEYAKNPGSFRQATALDPELRNPEFWRREEDREEAVSGALDRVLSRGELGDFERALDWFGEKKWASSSAELIRMSYNRIAAKSVHCRDVGLDRVLTILGLVLREGKESRSGAGGAGQNADGVPSEMGEAEFDALGRLAMRYLPGSSLLKSSAGRWLLGALHAQWQLLAPLQQEWVQKLRSLTEVQDLLGSEAKLEHEKVGELIGSLANAYTAMGKAEDKEVREWINGLLLQWVEQEPKKASSILFQFMNKVYETHEELFLDHFITPFRHGLVGLEKAKGNGLVATEFVLWCYNDRVQGVFGRRSGLVDGWLREFLNGMSKGSRARTDKNLRQVVKPSPETLGRWRRESGCAPPLIVRCLDGRRGRFLAPCLGVVALGLAVWLFYPELVRGLVYPHREPVERGKRLGVWLDRYRKSFPAVGESAHDGAREDAEGAIRKIGTNALPALLKMVQAKDSAVSKMVVRVFGLPSEDYYHTQSADGFSILGTGAKPAVRDLIRALDDKGAGVRACAAKCLGAIGPQANEALPRLRQLFRDEMIGKVRTEATNAVAQIEIRRGQGSGDRK